MDIISFNESATANGRIENFIKNPDSTSGVLTVPKTIAAGETITIPAGRVAVLPNVQVDGTLNIEGEVFIPSGATFSKVVETEGNQTIGGVKTFTSSPIVPTPTTGTQAVNKDYADLKVALASFIGTNQSLSSNGYQKLPGGLIIQWGEYTATMVHGQTYTVAFPIAFPNNCLQVDTSLSNTVSTVTTVISSPMTAKTSSNFTFQYGAANGGGYNTTIRYIAIGY